LLAHLDPAVVFVHDGVTVAGRQLDEGDAAPLRLAATAAVLAARDLLLGATLAVAPSAEGCVEVLELDFDVSSTRGGRLRSCRPVSGHRDVVAEVLDLGEQGDLFERDRVGAFSRTFPSARDADLRRTLTTQGTAEDPDPSASRGSVRRAPDTHQWDLDGHTVVHSASRSDLTILDRSEGRVWARLGADPWPPEQRDRMAVAAWLELGLAVEAGRSLAVPRPAAHHPSSAVPVVSWNAERAYRHWGRHVLVRVTDPTADRWVDAALSGAAVDPLPACVDGVIEVRGGEGAWVVVADDGVEWPCRSARELGPLVRAGVHRLAAAMATTSALAATVLSVDAITVLLVGRPAARAAIAVEWLRTGGSLLADDFAEVVGGGRLIRPASVGLEHPAASFGWPGELPGLDAAVPLFVTPAGAFVQHLFAPPGDGLPRWVDALVLDTEPGVDHPRDAGRVEVLEALLASLHRSAAGLSLDAAEDVVRLARRVPGRRVALDDPQRAVAMVRNIASALASRDAP
jgi:hypothetical protein